MRKWIVCCGPCILPPVCISACDQVCCSGDRAFFRIPRHLLSEAAALPKVTWGVVYHMADHVVPGRGIRAFCAQLRAAVKDASKVREKCFAQSRHVHHLTQHPKEYIAFTRETYEAATGVALRAARDITKLKRVVVEQKSAAPAQQADMAK